MDNYIRKYHVRWRDSIYRPEAVYSSLDYAVRVLKEKYAEQRKVYGTGHYAQSLEQEMEISAYVYVNSERNSSDDLFNANVYALAQQEIDPPGYVDCFSSYVEYDYITEKEYSHYVTITECMGCKDVDVVSLSKHGTCLKYPKEKR